MLQVELKTSDGQLVVKATIPPFQKLPEVLFWGDRTFVLTDGEYREGMGWHVLPGMIENGLPLIPPVEQNVKRTTFLVEDPESDRVITGGLKPTLRYVESYLREIGDGETFECCIERHDMTDAEIAAAPVQ